MSRVFALLVTLGKADYAGQNILGKGWDISTCDFWNYKDIFGTTFYTGMPDECYVDAACRHTSATRKEVFHSVDEWSKYNSQSLGISGGGPIPQAQMDVTVSASFSSSGSDAWKSDRSSFYLEVYNRRQCYQMRSDCVNNKQYLQPDVERVMSTLPKSGTDAATMQQWDQNFIRQFGSHINVASEHGGRIKIMESVEKQTDTSSSCLQQSVCANVKVASVGEAGLCPNRTECNKESGVSDLTTQNCVLVGGDQLTVSSDLCGSDTPQEKISEFLQSGNMTDPTSATQYTFQPITDIVRFMGFQAEANMVGKATEFHACTAPRFSWAMGANDEHECQCVLQCPPERSTLDPISCTCSCKGDKKHGFAGEGCAKDYGTCQKGDGTGKLGKCTGNTCASSFKSHTCTNTEVCCMSWYDGQCCPLGSTCHCPLGAHCECIPGKASDALASNSSAAASAIVV